MPHLKGSDVPRAYYRGYTTAIEYQEHLLQMKAARESERDRTNDAKPAFGFGIH